MSNIASSSHTFWGADTNMSVGPQRDTPEYLCAAFFQFRVAENQTMESTTLYYPNPSGSPTRCQWVTKPVTSSDAETPSRNRDMLKLLREEQHREHADWEVTTEKCHSMLIPVMIFQLPQCSPSRLL